VDRHCLDGFLYLRASNLANRYLWLYSGTHWPPLLHALYWVFSKPFFSLGLILTVLPSCLGITHSFFNFILSTKLLVYTARISFCVYLVHLMVIMRFSYMRNYSTYFDNIEAFVLYGGLLAISTFLGFVMTMTVELPFANLLKLVVSMASKNESKHSEEVPKM
jgi:peptidoglycan/LPS O-acetylase OafA/YrhL